MTADIDSAAVVGTSLTTSYGATPACSARAIAAPDGGGPTVSYAGSTFTAEPAEFVSKWMMEDTGPLVAVWPDITIE
jgi:hypothetical protein